MSKTGSAKDRIRAFFLENAGKVVNTADVRNIAGVSEYTRRIRELRNDEGWQIESHVDAPDLKPGQYRLISRKRQEVRVSHKVDRTTRIRILDRNGFTCFSCGLMAGDPEPDNPNRRVRLHVDHIDPDGPPTDENLRTTCNVCNEGRSNLGSLPPPNLLRILREVRRLARSEQLKLLEDLKKRTGHRSNHDHED